MEQQTKEVEGTVVEFDIVELTEPVDDAPVGVRGGVLELRAYDTAMVEITEPSLDAAARMCSRRSPNYGW